MVFFVGLPALILSTSYQLNEWDENIKFTSWHWWYDDNNDIIYNWVTDTLAWQYTTIHGCRRHINREYQCIRLTRYDTVSLRPCTVNRQITGNKIKFRGICIQGTIQRVRATTFLEFLWSECINEKWVYQNITIVGNVSQIATALVNEATRAVCDGSFDDEYGISGWCIDGSCVIIRGVNIVPLESDSFNTTRCELGGIYTVLRITECLASFHNITNGSIEIGWDCEGGIKRTLLRKKVLMHNYVNGSHLDLINSINKITRNVQFTVIGRHVYGHQDKHCIYEKLDWWSQRNIYMNLLAKSLMYARRKQKIKIRGSVY